MIADGRRGASGLLILLSAIVLGAASRTAADAAAVDRGDVARGLAMVGASTSEEPAVRREREGRDPSQGFMLGAALGAWINAAATLRYDLETPSGDGDDSEAIAIDCYDERIAFDHLEARTRMASLTPPDILNATATSSSDLLRAWLARRQAGQPGRCR